MYFETAELPENGMVCEADVKPVWGVAKGGMGEEGISAR